MIAQADVQHWRTKVPWVAADNVEQDLVLSRLIIEMNTFERSPARPIVNRPYTVDGPWFTGSADVATFAIEELVATKIRALYQRRKGRDLFDLWLAITQAGARPRDIADCFGPYRPERWTPELALQNLAAKLRDPRFTHDLDALVPQWPEGYDNRAAAESARNVIAHISN